jgi:hypothetical protein
MGDRTVGSARTGSDLARQALNVIGAVGQIAIGFVANVGAVSDEYQSPIVPAGYAFAIWGVIFLLLLVYAGYQALPSRATDPLLRSIGWFTGLAMVGDTVWTWIFTQRQFIVAQVLIFLIGACAIVALVRYADFFRTRQPSAFERWIIGPGVGLIAGWLTAAMFVGLASTLITLGAANSGQAAEIGGAGLLLFAAGVAAWTLTRVWQGPPTAWVPYGAAVIWAAVGVIVRHQDRSAIVAGVAGVIIVAVIALLALLAREARRPALTSPASA